MYVVGMYLPNTGIPRQCQGSVIAQWWFYPLHKALNAQCGPGARTPGGGGEGNTPSSKFRKLSNFALTKNTHDIHMSLPATIEDVAVDVVQGFFRR